MSGFVLQNTFIKLYLFQFLINIFMEIRGQNYALETVSQPKRQPFFAICASSGGHFVRRLVREVKLLGPLSKSIRSIEHRPFIKIITRMDSIAIRIH
jgi:hypothetical protein